MPADLPDLAELDYVARVNRVVDHVVRHLDQPLRLEDLAAVACFSPFHFHRIFRALTGETVHAFTTRVRLERALFLMSHHPSLTLTQVALQCGYSSSSHFSRSIRDRYGVPPRRLDLAEVRRAGQEQLLGRLQPQARHLLQPEALADRVPGRAATGTGFEVRVRPQPAREVAYLRVPRPYEGGVPDAAARLVSWAEVRGLAAGRWLGYQWDDPELVPLERCSYDVAVELPPGAAWPARDAGAGEGRLPVGRAEFAPTTVVEVDLDGSIETELEALTWLYGSWLPGSGFVPDDQPCFEVWPGRPFADGVERVRLTVQLPIRRP